MKKTKNHDWFKAWERADDIAEVILTVMLNMLVAVILVLFGLEVPNIIKVLYACMVALCVLLNFEVLTYFIDKKKIEGQKEYDINAAADREEYGVTI